MLETIPAKTLVTRNKSTSWFGTDFTMNIYKGCCHGCIYCDSRSDCYRVDDFDRVRIKENALMLIRNDLRRMQRRGVIGTGSMSDPYNPFEAELKLTRNALELINAYEFGVGIATKSPLVTRDIDILKNISEHSPVIVKITITTADDGLCKKLEQNVAPTSDRLKALKQLTNNGIFAGIILMPALPFINDTEQNITEVIQLAHENGARFIYPAFGVTLRNNQRDYYFNRLDELFPTLKEKYISHYGNSYSCVSPNAKKLYHLLQRECDKRGILYKMNEIVSAYKLGYENSQLTFF